MKYVYYTTIGSKFTHYLLNNKQIRQKMFFNLSEKVFNLSIYAPKCYQLLINGGGNSSSSNCLRNSEGVIP